MPSKSKRTALVALFFSFLTPMSAMAGKEKAHRDYASVGAVAEAAVSGEEFKFTAGIDMTRRFPLANNVGLLLGYSWQLAAKKNILDEMVFKGKLDLSIDNVIKNMEIYAGPGFWVNNGEASFAPQLGLRYHLGKDSGFYFSGEAGSLIKSGSGGGFIELGAGYRWDKPKF